MVNILSETTVAILNPLQAIWLKLVEVLPGLIAAILVLIVGSIVAVILGHALKVLLEKTKLDKIKEVREIGKQREIEYGGPCNSFEAASIYNHKNLLGQMEEIINAYTKIMYLRGLQKTKLNDDVSLNIVSYCI